MRRLPICVSGSPAQQYGAAAGFAGVVVWMSIALSQLLFRKHDVKNGGRLTDLTFRTPLYPLVPIAFVTFIWIKPCYKKRHILMRYVPFFSYSVISV